MIPRALLLALHDSMPSIINGLLWCVVVGVSLFIGTRIGFQAGVKRAPEKTRDRIRQLEHEKASAEERLEQEQRYSRRTDVIIDRLTEREEPAGLRAVGR